MEQASSASAHMADLLTVDHAELEAFVTANGFPRYRADQVFQWIHQRHGLSFDAMTNVPKSLKQLLAQHYRLPSPNEVESLKSSDGTIKYLLAMNTISVETVAIPTKDRLTVCFSSQSGCNVGCAFCATGQSGFRRNLSAQEIVAQVAWVEQHFQTQERSHPDFKKILGDSVTNLVAMGQGEPFLNYDALLVALREFNNPESFNIGARKITVSTSGIIHGIERFAREPEQFGLAVSLHSAIQERRNQLMPGLKHQPLSELRRALVSYIEKTHRRVTLEYTLIKDVNDDEDSFEALVRFCQGSLFHVNLIPLHPTECYPQKPSGYTILKSWEKRLNSLGINASLRSSRGQEINGACGQLANRASTS